MTDTKTDPAAVAAEYREKARKMREVAARTLYDEEAFGCITSVANDAGAEHCDRIASVLEAAAAKIAELEGAVKDTLVHLIGAESAYRRYAHKDALKKTRLSDMEKSIAHGRTALGILPGAKGGEDE